MKLEIESIVNFITHLINLSKKVEYDIDGYKLYEFSKNLEDVLTENYNIKWDYSDPWNGSNGRILRINEILDYRIINASLLTNIPPEEVHKRLPIDLIIWVDPGLVTYRIFDFYFELFDIVKDKSSWVPAVGNEKRKQDLRKNSFCDCKFDCHHDCI